MKHHHPGHNLYQLYPLYFRYANTLICLCGILTIVGSLSASATLMTTTYRATIVIASLAVIARVGIKLWHSWLMLQQDAQ